ncbi:unnamed protein product [Polarella glacialis]|uniref:Prolyl 4-hydroxylase alpha subunit domain-containing protein n=1 Tax=Polarella glacialis TaxID=89957 RepID=A0A813HS93_POLGL|nr:unnamed protein product [Polarella glacialis]
MDRGLDTGQQFRDMQASMAAALRSQGWFIRDGLLGTDTCLRIRAEVASLHASGLFAQSYSEVVETGEKIWRQGVHAMELGPETWQTAPTLVVYLAELMRELPPVLNESFQELHLSESIFGHKLAVSVGAGSHYPKHLDNVSGAPSDTRKLTAIYYMNPGWDSKNGGAIRLYDRLEKPQHVDVEPMADRLLLFWSDLLVHEVLPSWSSDQNSNHKSNNDNNDNNTNNDSKSNSDNSSSSHNNDSKSNNNSNSNNDDNNIDNSNHNSNSSSHNNGNSNHNNNNNIDSNKKSDSSNHNHDNDNDNNKNSDDNSSHRYAFTVWLTSENHGCIVDRRDPQFRLRLAHFPSKS